LTGLLDFSFPENRCLSLFLSTPLATGLLEPVSSTGRQSGLLKEKRTAAFSSPTGEELINLMMPNPSVL
jgi:hypothetical protein